jgi:hypothetical protein
MKRDFRKRADESAHAVTGFAGDVIGRAGSGRGRRHRRLVRAAWAMFAGTAIAGALARRAYDRQGRFEHHLDAPANSKRRNESRPNVVVSADHIAEGS